MHPGNSALTAVYRSRPMWLTKETAYSIERDGLRVQDANGAARTVPWHKIASVRVHWVQPKNQPRVHFCQITLKGERSAAFHFSQLRFTGILSYNDQSAAYNDFLRALTAKIADEAPQARFWTGNGPLERAILSGMLGVLGAGLLVLAMAMIAGNLGPSASGVAVFVLGIGAGVIWLGWKAYGWMAPKPFDPRALPDELYAPVGA